uniref:XK-related protein n=1 Tax=Angiostrongylus cantonensis TaxID=6313 RepID=A0A0K0CVR6_ANGCA
MPPSSASSMLDSYDLSVMVGMARSLQMICCVIELLMIYSESGSLSMLTFLIYSAICGFNLFHITKRWYYNIDGRYDLKQLMREREPTVRLQYGMGEFNQKF